MMIIENKIIMTQEYKELLFKDLCTRLYYKPIVHAKWSYRETDGTIKYNEADRNLEINDFYAIWDVKPYLHSMSSMTEDERNEYFSVKMRETERVALAEIYRPEAVSEIMDWLNAHHFDYRGLIEKGLALEAPEGMYK